MFVILLTEYIVLFVIVHSVVPLVRSHYKQQHTSNVSAYVRSKDKSVGPLNLAYVCPKVQIAPLVLSYTKLKLTI